MIIKNGGGPLLNQHKGSLIRALQAVYPDHSWVTWRFSRISTSQKGTPSSKLQYLLFQYVQRVSLCALKYLTDRRYFLTTKSSLIIGLQQHELL